MNRPHRLNAWTYQMGNEMAEAIKTKVRKRLASENAKVS
jgi:hypothetical protein